METTYQSTQEAHEALVNDALVKLADASIAQADRGKLAVSTLLTFMDYANDRVAGNRTQAYQRLVALAHPALKGGNAGFKNVKAFHLVMFARTLGPLDVKGKPDPTLYDKVDQAWRHDVRQGNKDMARTKGKKKKKSNKVVSLASVLTFIEKKLPKLDGGQDERNTAKRAFDAWYDKASGSQGSQDGSQDSQRAA